MHEELGIQFRHNHKDFYFMGLMREFRRGGKPEFYFYFQSNYTLDEIRASAKHAEEVFEIDDIVGFYVGGQAVIRNYDGEKQDFDLRVNRLLHDIEGRANLTLSLGIGLYYEMILRRAMDLKADIEK